VAVSELLPPPGWYDDGSGRQRWWTGAYWSDQHAPAAPALPQSSAPPQPSAPLQPYAQSLPYAQSQPAYFRPLKDRGVAYVFAILLAGFGAHHFYLGHVGAGIAYILLWWAGWILSPILIGIPLLLTVGVWWIVDLCTLAKQVDAANRRLMTQGHP